MAIAKKSYHHGDLRRVLLETATRMINADGVDSVTMRKLASRAGVSRTAAYHYFANKQELLCALAMDGFLRQMEAVDTAGESGDFRVQLRRFIRSYVKFSADNAEYYELMLGGGIWRKGLATDELRGVGDVAFRNLTRQVAKWQEIGFIDADADTLRVTQVIFCSAHGISQFIIDGIYVHQTALDAICDATVDALVDGLGVRREDQ
ncbi:MAG: TetR/AcrR family transcriptional regulator [Woeseiaceae bacterium]